MQTKQHARSVPQGTQPHLARPDALDLLEQFGTTVAVQRTNEIYGLSADQILLASSLGLCRYR